MKLPLLLTNNKTRLHVGNVRGVGSRGEAPDKQEFQMKVIVGKLLTKKRRRKRLQPDIEYCKNATSEEKFLQFLDYYKGLPFKDIYKKYNETLDWKRKRDNKFRSANWKCEKCKGRNKLQVHHKNYKKWFDVTMKDLIVLCDKCHREEHPDKV